MAGVVEEVGEKITDDIKVGDEVYGATRTGSLAEYACMQSGKLKILISYGVKEGCCILVSTIRKFLSEAEV